MSFSLRLFGGAALEGAHGAVTGPAAQRHRLALLAVLAASHPRAVSRDKLMAWLWPGRDEERARQLLNQAVHALRRELGAEAILSAGEELQFNPLVVRCDLAEFEDALSGGDPAAAIAWYAGPFLDGFFLADAPEFERWVDRERDRLAASCAKALEELAEVAEGSGDVGGAVEWWRRRAVHDPYDSRVALRYMQALERSGNRAGALQHGLAHREHLRAELEIEPDPEVLALMERLRRPPVPVTGPAPDGVGRVALPATAQPPEPPLAVWSPPSLPRRRRLVYGGLGILLVSLAAGTVWMARRGRTADPITTAQVVDGIAQAVARELERRQRGDTGQRLPQHRTRSIPAYELYLRGSDPAVLRSDSTALQALEYFRRAVALDSTYAAAWVGVARLTLRVAAPGTIPYGQARAQAETAVERALSLDDSLAEAHALRGILRAMAWDFAAAERDLLHAIALDPSRAVFREYLAGFYVQALRPEDALAEAERAVALNPLSPSATGEVARALLAADRCDEALARLEAIAALDPPLLRAASIATQCYIRLGRWDEAVRVARPYAERDAPWAQALLGYVRGRSGDRDEALAIQADLVGRWRSGSMGAYYLAFVPAGLGDVDQAFDWLDRAFDDGSLVFSAGVRVGPTDPVLDALRSDPRYGDLLRRLTAQNR